MDNIPAGLTSNSIIFALSTYGIDVTAFKLSYTRYTLGDGTSITKASNQLTAALAAYNSAYSANNGIYLSSVADEGNKFLFRADVPDAAFASGADEVIVSLYDDISGVKAQRIFKLKLPVMDLYNGRIWVDTNNGASGTQPGINGTANNPVNNIADALTLSAALGVKRLHFAQRSSVSIPTNLSKYAIEGIDYILDLNGVKLDSCVIRGAWVSGLATTDDDEVTFIDCVMGICSLPPSRLFNCKLTGVITMPGASGYYIFDKCANFLYSGTNAVLQYDGANVQVLVTGYEGTLEIQDMGVFAGNTLEITGNGTFIEGAGCVSGSPSITGDWKLSNITNLTPSADTNSGVNVTRINDSLTSGYNAHLKLKSLDVQNTNGNAITAKSTGGNGHGLDLAGNSLGHAINAEAGAIGHGLKVTGGSNTALAAVDIKGNYTGGQSGLAIEAKGDRAAVHIAAAAAASANGLEVFAGSTLGHGAYLQGYGANRSGLKVIAAGAGLDIDAAEINAIKAKTDKLPHSLKKNTALPGFKFIMRDATTGDPTAGFTVTAQRKLDADAVWTSMAGAKVDNGDGVYSIDIQAVDNNGLTGAWKFTAPGAKATIITFVTED